jgi:hypothetical protein
MIIKAHMIVNLRSDQRKVGDTWPSGKAPRPLRENNVYRSLPAVAPLIYDPLLLRSKFLKLHRNVLTRT